MRVVYRGRAMVIDGERGFLAQSIKFTKHHQNMRLFKCMRKMSLDIKVKMCENFHTTKPARVSHTQNPFHS